MVIISGVPIFRFFTVNVKLLLIKAIMAWLTKGHKNMYERRKNPTKQTAYPKVNAFWANAQSVLGISRISTAQILKVCKNKDLDFTAGLHMLV